MVVRRFLNIFNTDRVTGQLEEPRVQLDPRKRDAGLHGVALARGVWIQKPFALTHASVQLSVVLCYVVTCLYHHLEINALPGMPGVFAGGDCVTGPSTVIRAIEAGKVSAANIDQYLGFSHLITLNVEIPPATHKHKTECGRIADTEREALDRKYDFGMVELPMTDEETKQECSRCLRCDHFGLGALRDGRAFEW